MFDWRRTHPRPVINTREDLCEALEIPFSDEQLDAICAPLEPSVIIAGAGSGKTTVMAARVVWLVGSGQVRPEQVLGLTFTRKAAAELAGRVRSALLKAGILDPVGPDFTGEQVVLTYDAFAGRLVGEHGLRLGYEDDPLMVSGASRFRLARRVVNRAPGPFEYLSRLKPVTVAERLLALDGALQSHLVSTRQLETQTARFVADLGDAPLNARGNVHEAVRKAEAAALERVELAALASAYQDLKCELGVVEFADQMAAAARLVREVPAVAESVREQFAVVLLDEYQDTSSAQAQLLQGLFSGPSTSPGRGHPVTAVGDPFQAIYGWRGAAAANITRFAAEFPCADDSPAKRYDLTVNRRSGPHILNAANAIAAPLRRDPTFASEGHDHLLRAPAGTPAGVVAVGQFLSWPEEVAWVADRIVSLHETEPPMGVAKWSDVAVLLRRNSSIAPLYAALRERDVPCEIVGLGGLLQLPEVADVVATLRLLDDVTANPELVRLLTGPRWALGRGDLALLGRRAVQLARVRADADTDDDALLRTLEAAVSQIEPTEVVSLLDAVEDPGDAPLSPEARERVAAFAAELKMLRAHADEPVLDLVRRVIATLGLDVELAATPEQIARGGRIQLAAFVDAIAGYSDVDGDASLAGLLAYLDAEESHGVGLEQAVPSEADSVKLLTIHKAKGLEWDAVFIPALADEVFPATRVTDNWTTAAAVLPASLRGDADSVPQVGEVSAAGLKKYAEQLKGEQRHSEDRLAYVAVTRARRLLTATGHWWTVENIKPRGLSDYLVTLREHADVIVADEPAPVSGTPNPLAVQSGDYHWPPALDAEAMARREAAAAAVQTARLGQWESPVLMFDEAEQAAVWDAEISWLLAEARSGYRTVREVPLPVSLTTTQLLVAKRNPSAFAADLVRPMPKAPSRAGRFGTRFHEWVERRFGQSSLLELDELIDRADVGAQDESDFIELCERFAAGKFGARPPAEVEVPFTFVLDGEPPHLLRGRIDAVYTEPEGPGGKERWLIVDWKTQRHESADALQLAIYRIAWAELRGIDVSQVRAVFYYVRTDHVSEPAVLPDRAGLRAEIDRITC